MSRRASTESRSESNVPDRLEKRHVGMRVLYRMPNQAVLSEGVVEGFSPEERFVRLGKGSWVENGTGAVVAVLSGPKRRREAL